MLNPPPEKTDKRLAKVIVRILHLIGVAGLFGNVMMGVTESVYIALALVSGIILALMDVCSGRIWFVQLRGVTLYLKLMFLVVMHLYPTTAIPCLIAVIAISGFIAHAPRWIRYFSVQHWQVMYSKDDPLARKDY